MTKDLKETNPYHLAINCFGEDYYIHLFFKNKYDMAFFSAALAVEECTFEDVVNCFDVPLDTPFNSSNIKGCPSWMTLQEAKDKGFRMFVFRDNVAPTNMVLALDALTFLFYPEQYAKREHVLFWECNDLKFYFVPPSEQSEMYANCINFEFDKAVCDLLQGFDVKDQNGLIYLQPKNRSFNAKKIKAFAGLKLMGFDLENSINLLPGGKLMAVNKRDEDLLWAIKQVYKKPTLKDLFFAKKLEASKQNEG